MIVFYCNFYFFAFSSNLILIAHEATAHKYSYECTVCAFLFSVPIFFLIISPCTVRLSRRHVIQSPQRWKLIFFLLIHVIDLQFGFDFRTCALLFKCAEFRKYDLVNNMSVGFRFRVSSSSILSLMKIVSWIIWEPFLITLLSVCLRSIYYG